MRPRQLPPAIIDAKRRQWEQGMSTRIPEYRNYDALWATAYWSRVSGKDSGRFSDKATDGREWIEVNRIHPYVMSYVGQLFNPELTAVVTRGSDYAGDPVKAQKALNAWVRKVSFMQASQQADMMAIVYDGVGANIQIDTDKKDVLNRVTLDIIPWWEILPDQDVVNIVKQRFVGRVYWMPLTVAKVFFNDPTIKGRSRPADPYLVGYDASGPAPANDRPDMVARVMEIFNFVDDYYKGESDELLNGVPVPGFVPNDQTPHERGRREWYVLDEGTDTTPRRVMPLPFRAHDGDPCTPIPLLTYLSHLAQPLMGQSHVDLVVDQFREKMIVRSNRATNIRAQSPQVVAPRGLFDDDARRLYRTGEYGAVLEYDKGALSEGESIGSKIMAMPQQNVVYDTTQYELEIDKDIDRATLQGPAQRGQPVDISATQTLQLDETSKSEIAILAARRDGFLIQVFQTGLAAIRASIAAAGPDAVLRIVEGQPPNEHVTEIRAEDLDGNFVITVGEASATALAAERKLRKFVDGLSVAKPFMDQVAKSGDPIAALILDRIVDLADLGEDFRAERIMKLPKPAETVDVPRGPGAGSALPGQGSHALPPTEAGDEPVTAGGPQPGGEQTPDSAAGTVQNIVPR